MHVANEESIARDIQTAPASVYVPDIDDTHANASIANQDPFKFSHGFTGVDQPANYLFVHLLLAATLMVVLLMLGAQQLKTVYHNRRRTSTIESCQDQAYSQRHRYPIRYLFKKYFLYTSLQQNRQKRGSEGGRNTSITPTLPKVVAISIYCLSNIIFCLFTPAQPLPQQLAKIRGRSGTLAVFNLILTVLFALRNNPFIWLLNISYDTFNLFHRWIARLVILQSTAHVFCIHV
jgi:hypothetical protein